MTGNQELDQVRAHKAFAPDLYNRAWELIDKGKERTDLEDEEMLLAAYGSAYHWHKLEGVIEEARWKQSKPIAHDQLSRANSELGNHEMALFHASRSLHWCEEFGIGDLWLAFAYELVARQFICRDYSYLYKGPGNSFAGIIRIFIKDPANELPGYVSD